MLPVFLTILGYGVLYAAVSVPLAIFLGRCISFGTRPKQGKVIPFRPRNAA